MQMHTALAQMRIYTRCGIYMYALRCALQETTQVTSHKSQVTSQMNVARLMHMRDDPRHTNQTDDRVQVMPNERVQVISTSSQMNVSKSSQMNVSKSCHTHTRTHTHTLSLSLSSTHSDPLKHGHHRRLHCAVRELWEWLHPTEVKRAIIGVALDRFAVARAQNDRHAWQTMGCLVRP